MASGTTTKKARSQAARASAANRAKRGPAAPKRNEWNDEAAADWHHWSVVERLGWWAVVGAMVGVPTVFFKWGPNAFDVPKLAVLWACAWVALAGVVASVLTGRLSLVRLRVRWAIVAFAAAQVIATLLSISFRMSLFGTYGRYMGLVPILLFLSIAYAIVCYCAATPRLVRHLFVAIGVTAVAGSLVAILEPLGLDLGFRSTSNFTGTSVGLQGNSDFSAGALAISAPALLYLRVSSEQRWMRIGATLAIPLVLLSLYLLNSRGAIIALLVGLAVTGLLSRELLPRWISWPATGAVCLVLLSLVALGATRAGPLADRFQHIPLLRSETFVQRIDIWRGVGGVIAERPVFGAGPDTLDLTLPPHQPAELTLRPQPVDAAHDVFLQYGAGSGLIGMATYIALVGWTIAQAVRRRHRYTGSRLVLVAASVGTMAAYLGQATFSIDELQLAMYGWAALGMVLALTDPGSEAAHEALTSGVERRAMPVGWSFGLTLVAVAFVGVSVLPLVADAQYYSAIDIGQKLGQDPKYANQLQSAFERAETLNPLEATYKAEAARWVLMANERLSAEEKGRLLRWAQSQLDLALQLQPGETELEVRMARVNDQFGVLGDLSKFDEAERIFKRLEEQDPYNSRVRLERTYHLQTWKNATNRPELLEEMRAEAKALDGLPYLNPPSWCQLSQLYEKVDQYDDAVRTAHKCAELNPDDQAAQRRLTEAEGRRRQVQGR